MKFSVGASSVLVLYIVTCGQGSVLLFHPSQPMDVRGSTGDLSDRMQVLPPNFPKRFYNDFLLYYSSYDEADMPQPPWPTVYPPKLPYVVGRGQTWYADDLGIMVESYQDFCVPIFEPNSYFPCVIFNYNGTAYFISDNSTGYGPCCVYRESWAPPHSDFMQQYAQYYDQSTTGFAPGILNQTIDWWTFPQSSAKSRRLSVGEKVHSSFGGYGWARELLPSGYRAHVCFWFEGKVGWAQQLFYNFVDTGPRIHDLEKFELPAICRTDRACTYRP